MCARSKSIAFALLFLLPAVGLVCAPATAADSSFCTSYAQQAVDAYQAATVIGCSNLTYPVWSADYQHHFSWCLRVSEDQARADQRRREDALAECRASTGTANPETGGGGNGSSSQQQFCTAYAQTAVDQQTQNMEHSCGQTGAAWNPVYDDHYRWCLQLGDLDVARREEQKRTQALDRCFKSPGSPAGQETLPIPIPGPKAPGVNPIPIPEPSNGAAAQQGWRVLSPEASTIDLGLAVGAQTKVALQQTARRATTPIGRAQLIQGLLASPDIRSRLQAIPDLHGSPDMLAYQTMEGASVNQSVSAAGSPSQTAVGQHRPSPASGPTLPPGLDWHAGIQFNPLTAPPVYYVGGQTRPLGVVSISGAYISSSIVDQMMNDKVLYPNFPAEILLEIDLPNEPGTYILTFGFAPMPGSTDPAKSSAGPPTEVGCVALPKGKIWDFVQLPLTPVANDGGFAAIFTTKREPGSDAVQTYQIDLNVKWLQGDWLFGGVTVTRL